MSDKLSGAGLFGLSESGEVDDWEMGPDIEEAKLKSDIQFSAPIPRKLHNWATGPNFRAEWGTKTHPLIYGHTNVYNRR